MKNIHELMENAKRLKEEFIERKLFLAGQIGVLDKEINSLIKENAYNDNNDIDEMSYSLNLRRTLKELEKKRREFKNEFKIICDLDESNRFTYNMLGYTINEYSKMKRVMERLKSQDDIKFKNNGTFEFNIEGKNEDEIKELILSLKNKYSKVFLNKEESIIICYNNCRDV